MIYYKLTRKQQYGLTLLSLVFMLLFYSLLSDHQHSINPMDTTIPSWSQIIEGVHKILSPHARTGDILLLKDSQASFSRLLYGMTTGIFLALLTGLLMGICHPFKVFINPMLLLCSRIPPTGALAVFFVMAGTGKDLYIAMITFGIMPILALSISMAIKDIPEEIIHKGQTLGAGNLELLFDVILKIIFPKLIDLIRLQTGPAIIYLIAAEMICGDVGFGYTIRLQSRLLNMNIVYPYLIILASSCLFLDLILAYIRKKLCPWYSYNHL